MIALVRPTLPTAISEKLSDLKSRGVTEWKRIGRHTKKHLKEHMARYFQNGRCAYCECYLGLDGAHTRIDHFRPRSARNDLIFEWANLFLSCENLDSCDNAKADSVADIVDPTLRDPELLFDYLDDGEIIVRGSVSAAADKQLAEDTIRVLNLNAPNLKHARVQFWNDYRQMLQAAGENVAAGIENGASSYPSFVKAMAM